MQRKIPPQLVCGSCGACLNSMLPRVQFTAGLGFFLHSSHLNVSDDSDSPVVMRCTVEPRLSNSCSFVPSITVWRVFSARSNFCEAAISLPSSNICDYYIYEPIHSSNHIIVYRSSFLHSKTLKYNLLATMITPSQGCI